MAVASSGVNGWVGGCFRTEERRKGRIDPASDMADSARGAAQTPGRNSLGSNGRGSHEVRPEQPVQAGAATAGAASGLDLHVRRGCRSLLCLCCSIGMLVLMSLPCWLDVLSVDGVVCQGIKIIIAKISPDQFFSTTRSYRIFTVTRHD